MATVLVASRPFTTTIRSCTSMRIELVTLKTPSEIATNNRLVDGAWARTGDHVNFPSMETAALVGPLTKR